MTSIYASQTTKASGDQSPTGWVLEMNRPSLIRFPHDPKDISSLNLEEDTEKFFQTIDLQARIQQHITGLDFD